MKYLFLSSIVFLFFSCDPVTSCDSCDFTCLDEITNEVITNKCPKDYDCTFEIITGMKLTQDSIGTLVNDDGATIFSIYTYTEGDPNIADDEFSNLIYIQVDNNSTSFSYENIDLTQNVSISRTCFCWYSSQFRTTDQGCIQGEKIDNDWFIQGNIEMELGPIYQFDLTF